MPSLYNSNYSHKFLQEFTSTACIICTPKGNVFAWPELSQSVEQEPLQARISQEVTSLSDILVARHPSSALAISAILGAADGRLYRLHCTSTEAMCIIPLQPEVTSCCLLVYNSSHIVYTTCLQRMHTQSNPETTVCRKV